MQEFKAVLAGATRHKINQMQVPDSDDLLSLNGYIHWMALVFLNKKNNTTTAALHQLDWSMLSSLCSMLRDNK